MAEQDAPHVLLVDDDHVSRRIYADILKLNEFQVTEEKSAIDALERLHRGEKFDLVITDIIMAKMDGWELLAVVRNGLNLSDLELPVIVLTAFSNDELEVKAYRLGANAIFRKKIDPNSKLVKDAKVFTGNHRSKFSDV